MMMDFYDFVSNGAMDDGRFREFKLPAHPTQPPTTPTQSPPPPPPAPAPAPPPTTSSPSCAPNHQPPLLIHLHLPPTHPHTPHPGGDPPTHQADKKQPRHKPGAYFVVGGPAPSIAQAPPGQAKPGRRADQTNHGPEGPNGQKKASGSWPGVRQRKIGDKRYSISDQQEHSKAKHFGRQRKFLLDDQSKMAHGDSCDVEICAWEQK
ncbi:hypothetical protein IWZ00DRAFT_486653 [Phyllosticta capitalensis]|uniref:uncharacterized protein n=1 Tax=Phyllosticta capitalensis TaxID=121624 RepID=UPI003131BADF